ncbi:MAG: hypothetical protein ACKVQA_23530 [Burkholderiales bacterium]
MSQKKKEPGEAGRSTSQASPLYLASEGEAAREFEVGHRLRWWELCKALLLAEQSDRRDYLGLRISLLAHQLSYLFSQCKLVLLQGVVFAQKVCYRRRIGFRDHGQIPFSSN